MKLAVLLFALPVMLCAQTAEEKGRKLVDDSINALGGAAFLRMQDRLETGRVYSFYRERLTGFSRAKIYTRYLDPEPPTKLEEGIRVRERQAFGKDEDYLVQLRENGGFQVTFRGIKPMPKEQYERWISSTRHNYLYILRERLKEPGLIMEFVGSDIFDNQPIDKVAITDSENNVVTVFLHKSTHLPVRQTFYRRDPTTKERIEESAIFGLWRDVGQGVQWPFHMLRERDGMKVFEIFSESVSISNKFKDELFELPKELKVLPQK
ncbi:MAG TPA: hypothetical protein VE621_19470 [Bryobacteraceae bacterium]|jgi:hypothetical protein|nr:hypothetical protein [Bryobacteraceae bacterium]